MASDSDIRLTWLLAAAAAGAMVALAICASMVALTQNANDHRVVRIRAREELLRSIPPPRCDSVHRFCLSHDANGQLVALYTSDPHLRERHPCDVSWRPDLQREVLNGETERGFFEDDCGWEDTFDIAGHRVFGPTPRDLDSFSTLVSGNDILVDTHFLVCGKSGLKDTNSCSLAPSN